MTGASPLPVPDWAADLPRTGGEMGRRIVAADWWRTSLGPLETWSHSLRWAVRQLLSSKAQVVLFWGPDLVALYNDRYIPVAGAKHPDALGLPARELWPEIWDWFDEVLSDVMATGVAYWARDGRFLLERRGFPEECYFDVSYDPAYDDDGTIRGVYCIVSETTGRVTGERRMQTLRGIGAGDSLEAVASQAVTALAANPDDLPFALVHLLDEAGGTARLVSASGLTDDDVTAWRAASADPARAAGAAATLWQVLREGTPQQVDVADLLVSPPEAAAPTALVLPLTVGVGPRGALVAGTSRYLGLDGAYRDFFDLVVGRISSELTRTEALAQERRRAAELAELDRAKTAFFQNVSHEFRTPLTLMLAPVEDILADVDGHLTAAEQQARLETAHRNAERLLRLVNTLLRFSRIEAQRVEAVYEPVDLASLTADLASVFRSAIERAGLRFTVACGPVGEPVLVDREMWETIVFNLLSNAFKFTVDGEVSVAVEREDDTAVLTVRDTGVGIAAEDLPRLFERFHRPRAAGARTYEGTGIGLALVDELVRLHGGSIDVASEPGRGTTFRVGLPLGTAHVDPAHVRPAGEGTDATARARPYLAEMLGWLSPEPEVEQAAGAVVEATDGDAPGPRAERAAARVLVVDDNPDMLAHLAALLGRSWDVHTEADGEAALASARADVPDLVLTDVMMPGLDGMGLLRALRADPATAGVPVVMISARAGEEAMVEGLEVGADDYLVKPFTGREVVARVRANLELGRMRRDAARSEAAREIASFRQDLIAGVSHDMQTPLSAIIGFADILAERPTLSGETAVDALAAMRRQTRNLQALVQQFLDYARLEADQPLPVRSQPTDVLAAVRAVVELFGHTARIESDLPGELPPALADADRVEQVVRNLLSNALKFSSPDGLVTVRARDDGDDVVVEVVDRGIGMTREEVDALFTRFWRGRSGTDQPGSGLGLYVSRALVEAQGGHLDVDSAPGEGSRFTMRLPLAPRQWADQGLRVLVVDDEEDVRLIVTLRLEAQGWHVEEADSGPAALGQCRRSPFDVVVLDQRMPGTSGVETARQLRAERFGQPIVLFTAYLDPEVEAQAQALGLVPLAKAEIHRLPDVIGALGPAGAGRAMPSQ